MNKLSLICILISIPVLVLGQQGDGMLIQGRVVDSETGDAIPFVSVKDVTSGKGKVAEANGNFEIVVLSNTSSILISCIGYQDKQVNSDGLNNNEKLVVKLEEDVIDLKESSVAKGKEHLIGVSEKNSTIKMSPMLVPNSGKVDIQHAGLFDESFTMHANKTETKKPVQEFEIDIEEYKNEKDRGGWNNSNLVLNNLQGFNFGDVTNVPQKNYELMTRPDSYTSAQINMKGEDLHLALKMQDPISLFNEKLNINLDIRPVYKNMNVQAYVGPCVAIQYNISRPLKVKEARGIFDQFHTRVVREGTLQADKDFWHLADEKAVIGNNSVHYLAGISCAKEKYYIDIELYYK